MQGSITDHELLARLFKKNLFLANEALKHQNDYFLFTLSISIAVYGAAQTPMTEETVPQPDDPYRNQVFNIGADVPYGISELATEVARAFNAPRNVVHLSILATRSCTPSPAMTRWRATVAPPSTSRDAMASSVWRMRRVCAARHSRSRSGTSTWIAISRPSGRFERMRSGTLPRIRVCLRSYKRAHALRATVDSLFNQTHADFELNSNDDISLDRTDEVGREAERRATRGRYAKNGKNLRYATNQNAAMLRANHEHVAIVHNGDTHKPNLLEAWTRALVEHPSAVLAFSAAERVDAQGQFAGVDTHPYRPLVARRAMVDEMLASKSCPILGIVMVRRSRVLELGTFNPGVPTLADVDMWLRLLLRDDAAYVSESLYRLPPREAGHHNSARNWQMLAERELIYALSFRRRYLADPTAAAPVRRDMARMLRKSHLNRLVCLRHGEHHGLSDGLKYLRDAPPFGAGVHPDSVTEWVATARDVAVSPGAISPLAQSFATTAR